MLQKFVVALLVLTVIGALGVGIYDATQHNADGATDVLAHSSENDTFPANAVTVAQTADQPAPQATAQMAEPVQDAPAPQIAGTPIPQATQQSIQQQLVQATSMVGDLWSGIGLIAALDDNGMTLQRADGSEIYVELGPPHYWQGLDVTLTIGDQITVIGFFNGEQYHSATVIKADGSQMVLRSEEGQPMWSGSGNNGSTVGTNGNGNASEPQVSPEDWVTVDGIITAVNAQQLTMQAQTGELLDLQLGSSAFMAEQGVSFATGDPISVLGFWQDSTFRAGEITKTMNGERVMLLDPNGRPLWAGPGRAGNNAGGGNGGNGQGSQGQGGNGGQGQGQGQNAQGVQVPADQWESMSGTVAQVEPLAITLQVNGKTAYVTLGQVDFWTAQGITFTNGTALTVDGFWQNGQFEAGLVTFDATGYQLEIRDSFGRLLWTNTTGGQGQGGNGGGNGYQGGRNPDFQGGGNHG